MRGGAWGLQWVMVAHLCVIMMVGEVLLIAALLLIIHLTHLILV